MKYPNNHQSADDSQILIICAQQFIPPENIANVAMSICAGLLYGEHKEANRPIQELIAEFEEAFEERLGLFVKIRKEEEEKNAS